MMDIMGGLMMTWGGGGGTLSQPGCVVLGPLVPVYRYRSIKSIYIHELVARLDGR